MDRRKFFKGLAVLPFVPLMAAFGKSDNLPKCDVLRCAKPVSPSLKRSVVLDLHERRMDRTTINEIPTPIYKIHPFDFYEIVNSRTEANIWVENVKPPRSTRPCQFHTIDGVKYFQTAEVPYFTKELF